MGHAGPVWSWGRLMLELAIRVDDIQEGRAGA